MVSYTEVSQKRAWRRSTDHSLEEDFGTTSSESALERNFRLARDTTPIDQYERGNRPSRAEPICPISDRFRASAAALRALLAVALGQLLEARIRAQRREVGAGIEGGKIVKSQRRCFLQRGKGFLPIAASRISRSSARNS